MFRRHREIDPRAAAALSEQMSRMPAPGPSPGFDARVHAALAAAGGRRAIQNPKSKIQNLWVSLRPAVSAAFVSLLVTLALLQGMSLTAAPGPGSKAAGGAVSYGRLASIGGSDLRGELAALGVWR